MARTPINLNTTPPVTLLPLPIFIWFRIVRGAPAEGSNHTPKTDVWSTQAIVWIYYIFFFFWLARSSLSPKHTPLESCEHCRQPMAVRIDGSQRYARITLDYAGYERGRDSRVLCERICGGCQLYVRVLLKLNLYRSSSMAPENKYNLQIVNKQNNKQKCYY
jgi:hypothetical protein